MVTEVIVVAEVVEVIEETVEEGIMTAGEVDMIEVAEVDLTDLIAEEEITNAVAAAGEVEVDLIEIIEEVVVVLIGTEVAHLLEAAAAEDMEIIEKNNMKRIILTNPLCLKDLLVEIKRPMTVKSFAFLEIKGFMLRESKID